MSACKKCLIPFTNDILPLVCLDCGVTRCGTCFEWNSKKSLSCPDCFSNFEIGTLPTNYALLSNGNGSNGSNGGDETSECTICAEDLKFRLPQIFGCGHGMCRECLKKFLKLSGYQFHQEMERFYSVNSRGYTHQYCEIKMYLENRNGTKNCPVCRCPITKIVENKELQNDYNTRFYDDVKYHSIMSFDLRNLAFRLISQGVIPLNEIRKAIQEYRKFMILKKTTSDHQATILSPAPLVDIIWHSHILDTANYNIFCQKCIGFFVHHNPRGEFEIDEKQKRYRKTITEYIKIFGFPTSSNCSNPSSSSYSVWIHTKLNLYNPQKQSGNVVLKSINGKTRFISLYKHMRVWEVKLLMQQKEGIPVDQQRLIFSGKNIQDSKRLSQYGIEKDSVIHLVLRVSGC